MIAAYCDVDGTLTNTTIVPPLVWLKSRLLSAPGRWLWLASLGVRGPWWLLLDQFSRAASNRAIYSNYRGISIARTRALADTYYREHIKPKIFPQALERLKAFRQQGIRVVLVTGGLELFMQLLARDVEADCIAPTLEERDGVFTGQLTTEPLTGSHKTAAIRRHAAAHQVNLEQSYALGDALGDLPMLEAVGHPIAVNPDRRLAQLAVARGWPIERWKIANA
jgi:alcohol-forming fatty acyl-CoA reductase